MPSWGIWLWLLCTCPGCLIFEWKMYKILGKLSNAGISQPHASAPLGLWGYEICISLWLVLLPHKPAKPNTKSSGDSILTLFSTLGLGDVGICVCDVWGCLLNLSNPVYKDKAIYLRGNWCEWVPCHSAPGQLRDMSLCCGWLELGIKCQSQQLK